MLAIAHIKEQKRALINRYAKPDNSSGFIQILNTLLPYAALWYAVALSAEISYWLTAGIALLMVLFLTRIFVLMHDCGHGSMFRSGGLNRSFGSYLVRVLLLFLGQLFLHVLAEILGIGGEYLLVARTVAVNGAALAA